MRLRASFKAESGALAEIFEKIREKGLRFQRFFNKSRPYFQAIGAYPAPLFTGKCVRLRANGTPSLRCLHYNLACTCAPEHIQRKQRGHFLEIAFNSKATQRQANMQTSQDCVKLANFSPMTCLT